MHGERADLNQFHGVNLAVESNVYFTPPHRIKTLRRLCVCVESY